MATILYLRLDANNDPVFDPNVAFADLQAVQQAIKTRLLLFQGEWWENLDEGLPLFQQILGTRKKIGGQDVATLAITARIAATPFVSAVGNVTASVDPTRRMNFSATVQTIFGKAQIAVSPALAASLAT